MQTLPGLNPIFGKCPGLKKLFGALVSGQTLLNQRVPVSFMPNRTINPSAKGMRTAEK